MHPHDAYKRSSQTPRRIDLILALYRKALEQLQQARQATTEQKPDAARPLLARTQLIVSALASGQTGNADPTAVNFLRLYEFVAHQLTIGTVASIDAGTNIMRTLLEGFEAIRDEAVALEAQGVIPPLDQDRIVHLSA